MAVDLFPYKYATRGLEYTKYAVTPGCFFYEKISHCHYV